ncbi:MAG: cytochrome c [Rhodobacteraceae bacterium]|nr:cytochrome c [Paracoccaceae bacterium]MBR9823445.1 cytochrome c [Paracoccaceae bacterium]
MRKYLTLSVIVLGAAGAVGWFESTAGAQTEAMPEDADIVQGEKLYGGFCASCHGADLEGQPDWRSPGPDGILPAPPHDETGHTWHHSDSVLFDYTRLGGKAALALQGVEFESGMPGFGDQLSDAEIWNIIAYIKSTWPERQRAIQATRSAAPRQQEGN